MLILVAMKRSQLENEIDGQIKCHGEYVRIVARKSYWSAVPMRLSFEARPHSNPNVDAIVYSVSALPQDGIQVWDYTWNRNFDNRDKFVSALLRYIKNEGKTLCELAKEGKL